MPNGRPTWRWRSAPRRALGLTVVGLSLTASAGCQRLPLRPAGVGPSSPESASPPRELAPIADPAAVDPAAPASDATPARTEQGAASGTPLLDAALARAEAVQTETEAPAIELPPVSDPPAPAAEPVATPTALSTPDSLAEQPTPTPEEPRGADEPKETTTPAPEAPGAPAEAAPDAPRPAEKASEPEPSVSAEAPAPAPEAPPVAAAPDILASVGTAGPPAGKPIDPEKPAAPARDEWSESLARLRDLARRGAGRPGDEAEAWAIRARVLDWLAGDGNGDDPRGGADGVWNRVLASLATATASETQDEATVARNLGAAVDALETLAPLQVRTLVLCRKVAGFGQFEPLDAPRARAGRSVIVYCEMAGLAYVEADDGFRSRLASRVELVPGAGGEPVWSQALGTAEDHCRRRRRDYYVNYRLALPASVPPGPYTLRLTQTDLLAGRSVSGSVDLTVDP